MKPIRVTSAAQRDLVEAIEHLFSVQPDLAEDFRLRVEAAYQAISKNPRSFALLETNRTKREVRRLRLKRFRYLVIYELISDVPWVLSIMHTSRHPDAWQ